MKPTDEANTVFQDDAEARAEAVARFLSDPSARVSFENLDRAPECRWGAFSFSERQSPDFWREARRRFTADFRTALKAFLADPDAQGEVHVTAVGGPKPLDQMTPDDVHVVQCDAAGFKGSCNPCGKLFRGVPAPEDLCGLGLEAARQTVRRHRLRLQAAHAAFLSHPARRADRIEPDRLLFSGMEVRLGEEGSAELLAEAVSRELADAQPLIDGFLADPTALPPGSEATVRFDHFFLTGMRLPLPVSASGLVSPLVAEANRRLEAVRRDAATEAAVAFLADPEAKIPLSDIEERRVWFGNGAAKTPIGQDHPLFKRVHAASLVRHRLDETAAETEAVRRFLEEPQASGTQNGKGLDLHFADGCCTHISSGAPGFKSAWAEAERRRLGQMDRFTSLLTLSGLAALKGCSLTSFGISTLHLAVEDSPEAATICRDHLLPAEVRVTSEATPLFWEAVRLLLGSVPGKEETPAA